MEQAFITQGSEPVYPQILWNRPITRTTAGRLLLIGGHFGNFQAIQAVYSFANSAGIGQVTTVLPDALRPVLSGFDDTFFVPASPSGSIGQGALSEILALSHNNDAFAIGANVSNNSETAIVLERLLTQSDKPALIYDEALSRLAIFMPKLAQRPKTTIVVTMPELIKLGNNLSIPLNIQPERGLLGRVELARTIAASWSAALVVLGREILIISGNEASVTPAFDNRLRQAAYGVLSTFWTQGQSFAALTTAAFVLSVSSKLLADEDSFMPQKVSRAIERAIEYNHHS